MPKRILLIDSDESFVQGLAAAADRAGFSASVATNSEHGMTLAQRDRPDLVVVCVEAQPTNGYMLCTRLKKDDQLKAIPVILTSANATPDSFEKHKKLKTRAEDYLIKPFGARDFLEAAARLLGIPTPEVEAEVQMDDESLGLESGPTGEDEPIQLGEDEAAEARSAGDEQVVELEELVEIDDAPVPAPGGDDSDLDMFDQAFDALPAAGKRPVRIEKPRLRVAPDPAPEPQPRQREPTELSAPSDEQLLGLDEDSAFAELENLAAARKPPPARADPKPRSASRPRASDDASDLRRELEEKEKQLAEFQEQQGALERQAQQLKDEAVKRDASAKALQQRADALAAAAKKFERELTAAREELKSGGGKSQLQRLEADLEKAREEIAALTGEKDLLREERDELRAQLSAAQSAAKQNEDRALRAYQKMKGDDKLRERMRKALQIALALLEEGAVDAGSAAEAEKKSA